MPSNVVSSPPPFLTSINSTSFPDDVTRHILKFHQSLPNRSAKPQKGQWTVLACFFSYTPVVDGVYLRDKQRDDSIGDDASSSERGHVRLLSLATGVKCLAGNTTSSSTTHVLEDMHAEILARRDFELLLMEEILQLNQVDLSSETSLPYVSDLLERKSKTRFQLKKGLKLFLYTSHAPCGPASSTAHLNRLQAEDDLLTSLIAEASTSSLSTLPITNDDSIPPPLSTSSPTSPPISSYRLTKLDPKPSPSKKPSRQDAYPTSCYTCSDKLSRFQILGFQGGRLARFFDDDGDAGENEHERKGVIRLDGVVVGEDFNRNDLERMLGFSSSTSAQNSSLSPSKDKNDESEDPDKLEPYSRLSQGVQEILPTCQDNVGLDFLSTIPTTFHIFQTHAPFSFSRACVTSSIPSSVSLALSSSASTSSLPSLSASDLNLPLPVLRTKLLPPPSTSPHSIASSWHSNASLEIISPSGTLVGISKKMIQLHGEAIGRSRLSRGKMVDVWGRVMESCGAGNWGDEDGEEREVERKGSEGWRLVSSWMEERGPWKDWHDKV